VSDVFEPELTIEGRMASELVGKEPVTAIA
jgi:hypothetical protein